MNKLNKSFYIIFFLFFFSLLACSNTKKISNKIGKIEVEKRVYNENKTDWKNRMSNIRVIFYDNDRNNEQIGLMILSINDVHFLAELDGVFERSLYNDKTYEFKFYAPGFLEQKKKIKIEKGSEYIFKAFMRRDTTILLH